jgi:hypothetical protein
VGRADVYINGEDEGQNARRRQLVGSRKNVV